MTASREPVADMTMATPCARSCMYRFGLRSTTQGAAVVSGGCDLTPDELRMFAGVMIDTAERVESGEPPGPSTFAEVFAAFARKEMSEADAVKHIVRLNIEMPW